MKTHYTKTTIKAGQTFRLLAVFEDDRGRSQRTGTNSKTADSTGTSQTDREKIRGRYVQILSDSRQVNARFIHLKVFKLRNLQL